MIAVTLLGTGGPIPDAHRAGPATLVTCETDGGQEHYLVDAGRGALMRLAAVGLRPPQLTAVLLTHLHSDHITDLNDVITSQWILTFQPTPLRIIGPAGTRAVVDHLLASLAPDIGYRIAHHDDLTAPPLVEVTEVHAGRLDPAPGSARITVAPTDHRPVEPSVGFRIDHGRTSVVLAGDTVPCAGLDELSAGADAIVHTVIRKDLIAQLPIQRMLDTLDYHSSPEEAADTAARAGAGTLVLTHYVPPVPPGGAEDYRTLAATRFGGRIEVGDDLHRIELGPADGGPH